MFTHIFGLHLFYVIHLLSFLYPPPAGPVVPRERRRHLCSFRHLPTWLESHKPLTVFTFLQFSDLIFYYNELILLLTISSSTRATPSSPLVNPAGIPVAALSSPYLCDLDLT